MNDAASKSAPGKSPRGPLRPWMGMVFFGGLSIVLVFYAIGLKPADLLRSYTPHAPAWGLLAGQPLILQFHIAMALLALVVGLAIMIRPKGVGLHKTLGWTWVLAMAATAISSFFLILLPDGGLSIIHILSGWVVVLLPVGVFAIRRANVNLHRRTMTGLYMGGLVIAGALTLLPGRLMWRIFFS